MNALPTKLLTLAQQKQFSGVLVISSWTPAAEILQSLGHEVQRISYTDLSLKVSHTIASLEKFALVWCDVPNEQFLNGAAPMLWGAAAAVLQAARS